LACRWRVLISRTTIVIDLSGLRICFRAGLLVVAVLLPLAALADDAGPADTIAADARFDKTGDGIVDAADWSGMKQDERLAYARASVEALGENPDVQLPGGKSRAEIYLDGLREVYE